MDISLEVDSVLQSFGLRTLLTDIYLKCVLGDIIALFGRNGTGKSTLFDIIYGTRKAERSFVRINEEAVLGQAFKTGLISYLPQSNFLPKDMKVSKILRLCNKTEMFPDDEVISRIRNTRIKNLSGGELRYLEIRLVLTSDAPFVILDEPFNGLSPVTTEKIRYHITESARKRGIIMTDHNYREVHKVANKFMLLDEGYLKEINNPEELIPFGYYSPDNMW